MSFTPQTSVLLLIDLQQQLMPAIADAEATVANVERLGQTARLLDIPVLATEQNPAGLGPNIPKVKELAHRTLVKQFFDATREAAWATFLPDERSDVIVAGCEAHVCVMQTVLGLRRLGKPVRLVRDATSSRTHANREAAAHRAERAGAELVTTEMMIFEWLGSAKHPGFRDVLKLLR